MEERCTIIFLCVFFGALCGGLTALDFSGAWKDSRFLLESVILFIGCANMIYGTYDIYDDTVRRKDERSDAFKFAQLSPCMAARCVGCVWFLIAATGCVGAIAGTIIIAEGSNGVGKDSGGPCSNCLAFWKMVPALAVLGSGVALPVAELAFRRGKTDPKPPNFTLPGGS
uniref:Uncharacterized protein n=1 Tax=Coccolithus braarudii TaxID=221442 RepID=A0A7S0Q164_9EUKA|mmetsp:Transcript_36361/g.77541  ORF Transcript_36361/g.77541 Transcript_36361/m.77541 type:complete len:170 (+) Transcript_36361:190-699(+)